MTSEQTNVYCDESKMVLIESSSLNEALVHTEVDVKELKKSNATVPLLFELDYSETGSESFPKSDQRISVIEVFSSYQEAERVVLAFQRQGLASYQISIISKKERDIKVSINCEHISISREFLIEVLDELQTDHHAKLRFINAVDAGKFLVIAIGTAWEARKALYVLDNIAHWHFINLFKSILTFPL
ncbi:hypothetical protein Syn7502_02063 [Synechococcus sp. PCC 7502]|uniref:hypothetical protein n=1 Tax=Synechococcus sp. PCC 7502 TaxID=1173263 RepID=UPI00029FA509|nr:hypothetical protein [Synechococcus sp. PCC 7502]AFY74085.1 hypothetical protein Syn7502_02063 [Synechococcus sp. PCC 7502]